MLVATQRSKGIVMTFYTTLIAFITIAFLVLLLVLFIQRNYDIRLTIHETEQDRSVINLGQALLSSPKLNYVDVDGVVHRGVIDGDNVGNVNMDDLQKEFGYNNFYYLLTIRDLDKKQDVKKPTDAENNAFKRYGSNIQQRDFPVAIRYAVEGVTDAGVMSIKSGFYLAIHGGNAGK